MQLKSESRAHLVTSPTLNLLAPTTLKPGRSVPTYIFIDYAKDALHIGTMDQSGRGRGRGDGLGKEFSVHRDSREMGGTGKTM